MATEIAHTEVRSGAGYVRVRGESVPTDGYFRISAPPTCRLKHLICDKISGTATTYQPAIRDNPGTAIDTEPGLRVRADTAGANVDETMNVTFVAHAGAFFVWPGPDAGSDNIVEVELHFAVGMED